MSRTGCRVLLQHWLATTRWEFTNTPTTIRLVIRCLVNKWVRYVIYEFSDYSKSCIDSYLGLFQHGCAMVQTKVDGQKHYDQFRYILGTYELGLKICECGIPLVQFVGKDYWCNNCCVIVRDNHKIKHWTNNIPPRIPFSYGPRIYENHLRQIG